MDANVDARLREIERRVELLTNTLRDLVIQLREAQQALQNARGN